MGTEIGKAKSKRRKREGGAKEKEGRGSEQGGWRKFGLLRQSYAAAREGEGKVSIHVLWIAADCLVALLLF